MRKYLVIAIIILLVSSASVMAKDDGNGKGNAQSKETVKTKGPSEVTTSGTVNIPSPVTALMVQDNAGSDPTNTVVIKDHKFQPAILTVPVGTTVTWHNEDGTDHTVTSDAPGLFNSGALGPGKKFSFNFNTPGSYSYYCSIHRDMRGTIEVTGDRTSSASSSARSVITTSGQAISGQTTSGQTTSGQVTSGQIVSSIPPSASSNAGSSASWSENPLSQSQMQSISQRISQSASQGVSQSVSQSASQGISQGASQSASQNAIQGIVQGGNQNIGQNINQSAVLQYSQYYSMAPQPPSQPLTAPVQYQIQGQEPSMLYFGSSQKAVQFSQYQTCASYARTNSLWIQGASSWTQYVQIPLGASLSMIAVAPTNGNGYLYEANPDGTLTKNSYLFYPYNQMGFYADTVGQHLLFFMVDGQPSNIVVVDVIAYQPPPPVFSYASVTISSTWLSGYSVYLDGNYQAREGEPGQPMGSVNILVPGNQYHTIAVSGPGFSFSDYRLFRAGWSYTLNV